MPTICPTITAYDPHEYRSQMEQIEPFAKQIHIDMMDGVLAPKPSPTPDQIWWPEQIVADIHLMYQRPMEAVDHLLKLRPHLIVIHFEADVNHKDFASLLQENGVKAGLAIMQNTSVDDVGDIIEYYDQVLVFSGNLGFHGGETDLTLLDKVRQIKDQYPGKEVSWDGGINADNAKQLVEAGVDVLNVGGFIQKSQDPAAAYQTLVKLLGSGL